MKTTISFALLSVVVLLQSCATAFRTGQTPDDVYFSPARPEEEYVSFQRQETRRYRVATDEYEDRYLRMRVQDRLRWDELNDWYTYERNTLGLNSYFSPSLNPYVSWNHYYNPYYSNYPYQYSLNSGTTTAVKSTYTKPRMFNLNSYQAAPINIKSVRAQQNGYTVGTFLNNASTGNINSPNRGNNLRETFGISSSSAPASGNSSSSSGGSATPAPVRKF
jgi:hypothetical protein